MADKIVTHDDDVDARMQTGGSVARQIPPLTERQKHRFWRSVNTDGDCWLWTGKRTPIGYGQFHFSGQTFYAHRVAFTLAFWQIQDGFELDHRCRNRACVNPQHLEEVTRKENILRGEGIGAKNARKTVCKNGHPFDAVGSRNCRQCSICHRERSRKAKARRRAAARMEAR